MPEEVDCLGINLTKDRQDLFTEPLTLLREIKDLNMEVIIYYSYELEKLILLKW